MAVWVVIVGGILLGAGAWINNVRGIWRCDSGVLREMGRRILYLRPISGQVRTKIGLEVSHELLRIGDHG